jgi:hypothetical protein
LTTVPVKIKMGGAKMITGRHWLTVNLLTNKLVDSCGGVLRRVVIFLQFRNKSISHKLKMS